MAHELQTDSTLESSEGRAETKGHDRLHLLTGNLEQSLREKVEAAIRFCPRQALAMEED